MTRKIRKNITIGSLEKKLNLAPGSIKNLHGRDARSDKKLATLQKESAATKKKGAPKPTAKSTVAWKNQSN